MDLADIFQTANTSKQNNSYSICYLVKIAIISFCSFYIYKILCSKIVLHEGYYTPFISFVEN